MTEQKLRQRVADIMTGWVGATRGSAKHLEILEIYNNHKPLARGYKMKVSDAHCAATTSAAWIKAGIADYTGTECGVGKFITIAQNKGIWVENDAYVPKVGDAVVYDWDDSGVGDNKGAGDHIGIVTKAGDPFVVTEGNMSGGVVGQRNLRVNARYIRGFICPDYAAIAPKIQDIPDTPAQPAGDTVYTVVKGDTLSKIAAKYGTTVQALAKYNGITNVNLIHVGQTIRIPGAGSSSTTAPAPATPSTGGTVNKLQAAMNRDDSLAGAYTVTAKSGLNLRYGADADKYGVIRALPYGTTVRNYGYFNVAGGVKWLYVKAGSDVGYVSSEYLKKA